MKGAHPSRKVCVIHAQMKHSMVFEKGTPLSHLNVGHIMKLRCLKYIPQKCLNTAFYDHLRAMSFRPSKLVK